MANLVARGAKNMHAELLKSVLEYDFSNHPAFLFLG